MNGIVDAHHHIWTQADLPWLVGPMQPRIFGPYEDIRRDYLIDEYLADIAGAGIERSVYVQTNWAPERFEDEVAWVQRVSDGTGWPHAIIGYADFLGDDIRPQLDTLRKYPAMRGVRMQLHWHRNEMYRFAANPTVMNEPAFRNNMAHFAETGWSFDLQVFAGQMADAAALAADFPGVPFVLQHAGMLEDPSDEGRATWRAGMGRLAAQPNIVVKLSGLGTFIHRNDPSHIKTIVDETLDLFTAERCMFGSNFPIERLWTDYGSLVAGFNSALADRSEQEAAAVWRETAMRVYRLA